MRAVLNTCNDFFMEKIVTQSRLVLKTQLYPSSVTLGADQEETSLVFWFPTKSKSLDFTIIVLNLRSPSKSNN